MNGEAHVTKLGAILIAEFYLFTMNFTYLMFLTSRTMRTSIFWYFYLASVLLQPSL